VSEARTIDYEPGLDGLRACSITAVLLFHACATAGLTGWFRGGGLGVSVFFTLSGFLITTLLVTELERRAGASATGRGTIDLARFWSRRLRRLAPAAFTVVVAVLLLGRTSWIVVHRADAVASVWSATNWRVVAAGPGRLLQTIVGPLGPTWSLAVEEQCYVVLALVVAAAARSGRHRRVLATVLAVVVAASIGLANVVSDFQPRLEFGTDVRAAEVAIGGLLALAVLGRREQLTRHSRALDAIGVLAAGGLVWLVLHATYSPRWLLRGGFSAVAILSATLVAAVLAHGRLAAALSWRPLVALGRLSYSLYLVHWPVVLVLSPERTSLHGWVLVLVRGITSLVLACALHLLVEQPLRTRGAPRPAVVMGAWLGSGAVVTVLALGLGR
jgi:peptidoglycan/LPS O-acetylase OafA/YrhL